MDGITKLNFTYLIALDTESAQVKKYKEQREREREWNIYGVTFPFSWYKKIFKTSINKLAHHLLDFQLSVHMYMRKQWVSFMCTTRLCHTCTWCLCTWMSFVTLSSYVRICLESNGHGQLPVKVVQKLMMVPKASKDILNYFESAKTNVKEKVWEREREGNYFCYFLRMMAHRTSMCQNSPKRYTWI